jgi:hypothetical protein
MLFIQWKESLITLPKIKLNKKTQMISKKNRINTAFILSKNHFLG